MKKEFKNSAFSIAEILIALGILTVAMVFIAGVFPVGIHFTQQNVDKTTAAIVANEAFAKIKLYAAQTPDDVNGFRYETHRDFNDWIMYTTVAPDDTNLPDYYIDANAFTYPSEPSIYVGRKKYCWSAICRKDPPNTNSTDFDKKSNIQVTVFVCNRGSENTKYYKADVGEITGIHDYTTEFREYPETLSYNYGTINTAKDDRSDFPQPVRVEVLAVLNAENEIQIVQAQEKVLINNGDLLVDDYTGEIFRVIERYTNPDNVVLLDDKWKQPGDTALNNRFYMWVVPSAASPGADGSNIRLSGKSPCIEIYQKVIRF